MPTLTQYRNRNDVAATWAAANPVLALGEIGFESDHGRHKIGNGVSSWNALPYAEAAIDPRAFGAKWDGITDDTAALVAALAAAHAANTYVQLPEGTGLVTSVPIKTDYEIVGKGRNLTTVHSVAGPAFTLAVTGAGIACNHFRIEHMKIQCDSGTAINSTATNVTNGSIKHLAINAANGLLLKTYTQACEIDDIYYSDGAIDKMLHLCGNVNIITNLDKEGAGTDSPVGDDGYYNAYVVVEDYLGTPSSGNRLENIIVEGVCDGGKSGLVLDGCDNTTVRKWWYEALAMAGEYGVMIKNSRSVHFKGGQNLGDTRPLGGYAKLGLLNNTGVTYFEDLFYEAQYVEIDGNTMNSNPAGAAVSRLEVERWSSYDGRFVFNQGFARCVKVGQHVARTLLTAAPAGFVIHNVARATPACQNLLINPSWDMGATGWSCSPAPEALAFYGAITGPGQYAQYHLHAVNSPYLITQDVYIAANAVGRPFTFSLLAAMWDTGQMTPYVSGPGGLASGTDYGISPACGNWQIITVTFTPLAAGVHTVGVRAAVTADQDVYFDEACLIYGAEGALNSTRFGSLDLGGLNAATGADETVGLMVSATKPTFTPGRPMIVLNADLTKAKSGWVYTTPTGWRTLGPPAALDLPTNLDTFGKYDIPAAKSVFLLADATDQVDVLGVSGNLSQINAALTQQAFAGLVGRASKVGIKINADNHTFRSGSSAWANPSGRVVWFVGVFQFAAGAAGGKVMGQRQGGGVNGFWDLDYHVVDPAQLYLECQGTTYAGASLAFTGDDLPHYFCCIIDDVAKRGHLITDFGEDTSDAYTGTIDPNSDAQPFELGETHVFTASRFLCCYLAEGEGAALADAPTKAQLDAWWAAQK